MSASVNSVRVLSREKKIWIREQRYVLFRLIYSFVSCIFFPQKIRELIQALDRQKDEAIERTFKGVAHHFQKVFSELVPDGKGQIVMQKLTTGGGMCFSSTHHFSLNVCLLSIPVQKKKARSPNTLVWQSKWPSPEHKRQCTCSICQEVRNRWWPWLSSLPSKGVYTYATINLHTQIISFQ